MEKLGAGDPMGVPPGLLLRGRIGAYRLMARLGAGGMGNVYLARSDRGRTVAVKLVRRELAQQEEFRARFRQEVQAARRVGGHWTAPVLDADTEAEIPWVATGYVAGPTLQTVVSHDHGALPERSVRILAAGLAHALQDIHAAGLIHRDLKPSNVLVTIDGPRVIDFGIARALETVTAAGLTRTGALVGSPGFMAPEQVRGDRITPACDVFCLGSVLVYAATGVLPFGTADSGVHALMFRIVEEDPDLKGMPEELADLVRDCLRKDPAARPTPAQLLERTGAEDTVSGGRTRDPWLPSALVAQLGRHAVRLLDAENPEERPVPAAPAPAQTPPRTDGLAPPDGGGRTPSTQAAAVGADGRAPGGGGRAPVMGGPAPGGGGRMPGGGPASGGGGRMPGGGYASGGGGQGSGAGKRPSGGWQASGGGGWPPGAGHVPGAYAHAPGVVGGGGGGGAVPGAGALVDATVADFGPGVPETPVDPARQPPADASAGAPAEASPQHASASGAPDGSTPPPPGPPTALGQLPAQVVGPGHSPAPPAYGYPQQNPQPPACGYPQNAGGWAGTPAAAPGQGPALGPTPPYGPPSSEPSPYGGPGPQAPSRRSGRSTAALIVVALVVALGAGGSVYALMRGGGTGTDNGGSPSHTSAAAPTAPAPTTPAPSAPAGESPGSQSPTAGAVPDAYLGTWTTAIDNSTGRNPRRLVIQQGEAGDTVLSLTADGPTGSGAYHCVFQAKLDERPTEDGPLKIGPSTVTVGEPASSCAPGAATELTILPDGRLRRVNTSNGGSLTYTKEG